MNIMTGILIKKKTQIDLEKSRSHSIVSARANDVFLDTKKYPKKAIKGFLSKKFKEYILQEQKGVFINAMNLYNDRNKIIKLFESKGITPSVYPTDAKSEPKEHDEVKESEQKFEESIEEIVKLRGQKSDELDKMIAEKDEIINKDLFKKYFHQFESLFDMQKKFFKTQNA